MIRKSLVLIVVCTSLALAISLGAAVDTPTTRSNLSAAAVVDKNVAARGGLQAWRAVQTMTLEGKLGAGGNRRATIPVPMPDKKGSMDALPKRSAEEIQLPFVMELARPRKQRFELRFNGQKAIQVYDGSNGWKLRPYLNRLEVEPFTAEEAKKASLQADLDGPLVDYAAKGTKIESAGMEKVEGRDTYKVKLTLKDGNSMHVWIDAQTFLEVKIEGQPRRLDGIDHPVEVYFRDYRAVNGLQIPFVLETKVLPVNRTATGYRDTPVPVEKIALDNVVVNPKLDPAAFTKPVVGAAVAAK